jgi:hypothetical protein
MKARSAAYWTTTTLIALAFLSGGLAYLARAEAPLRGIAELGYPPYFITLLGIWKVLGAVVIVAPGLPRLKEWAYAGIVFDLTAAVFSHVAMGEPASKLIGALAFLGLAAASWALRPASRVMGAVIGEPGPAPAKETAAREIAKAAA